MPEFGRKKLARLTTRDIRAFLTKTAATCQCCEKLPSDRTVRFLLVILRAALQHAVREDELPRNLNRSFEALCVRAGARKVRFHDLRHTCASLLHEQGADARMIMEVLGHSSIRVTMDIYTLVRLDSQRSAFDRVGMR